MTHYAEQREEELTMKQPNPTNQDKYPDVYELVLKDLAHRVAQGEKTYGVRLKPHNGRNALWDAYEEALDLAFYLRQAIYEATNDAGGGHGA